MPVPGAAPTDVSGRSLPGAYSATAGTTLPFNGGTVQTDGNTGQQSVPMSVEILTSANTVKVGGSSQPPLIPATAVIANAAAAQNTQIAPSMAGVSAKTNYLTGIIVTTQGGSGAAAGEVSIAGLLGGTIVIEVGSAANNPINFALTFPQPLPASAVNTAITATVPTLGANTGRVAATLCGFVQ